MPDPEEFIPYVTLRGVTVEGIFLDATKVQAEFPYGIPHMDGKPKLVYSHISGEYAVTAWENTDETYNVLHKLDIVQTEEAICGFAGGCPLVLQAPGIGSTMLGGDASIQVCGGECVVDHDLSTADTV